MSPLVIQICVFGSVSAAAALICSWLIRDQRILQARLHELHGTRGETTASPLARPATGSLRGLIGATWGRWAAGLGDGGKASRRLEFVRAGMYSPTAPAIFTSVRLTFMLVPFAVGCAMAALGWCKFSTVFILVGPTAVLGLFLPAVWLRRCIGRRQTELRRSLPDFLDIVIVCLESGMSFESALQRTTEELHDAHPILALELDLVQRELSIGKKVEDALLHFAHRTGLDVIRILATNVQQARRLGIRMADNLRTHADILRTQRENRAEELAQKAAVKILFPTLLCIFPAIFVVLVGPAALEIQSNFSRQIDADAGTLPATETRIHPDPHPAHE